VESFLAAVQFLTRIRIKSDLYPDAQLLGRSTQWFPVVGFLIGLILWGCHKLLCIILPQMASDVLLILILTALSGGIHVDGFTDAVEGFYAGRSKEDILRIMRDTHIGSIGALALFSLLALKIAFLAALPQAVKGSFLLIMPMLGRWIIVFLAAIGKYARNDGGLGEAFFTHTSLKQFLRASIFPLIVILVVFPVWGLAVLGILLALNYVLTLWIRARIDGLTGDILGALNEVTEITVLFLGAVSVRLGLLSL